MLYLFKLTYNPSDGFKGLWGEPSDGYDIKRLANY